MPNEEAVQFTDELIAAQPTAPDGEVLVPPSPIGADPTEAFTREELTTGETSVLTFPGAEVVTGDAGEDSDNDDESDAALRRANEISRNLLREYTAQTNRDTMREARNGAGAAMGFEDPDELAEQRSEAAFNAVNNLQRPAGSESPIAQEAVETPVPRDMRPEQVIMRAAETTNRLKKSNGLAWRQHNRVDVEPVTKPERPTRQHDRVTPQANRLKLRGDS